jgi:hypothetical protein
VTGRFQPQTGILKRDEVAATAAAYGELFAIQVESRLLDPVIVPDSPVFPPETGATSAPEEGILSFRFEPIDIGSNFWL